MMLCLYIVRTRSIQKFLVAVIAGITFSSGAFAEEDITPKMPTAPEEVKPAEAKKEDAAERVEVIGSRIKRIATEGPSAVKTVDKEKMENSANLTVSDVLRDSNVATFGVSREASGSDAAATTNIGLRGLGATRTLVLLNGHRLPKDPSTEAVDLNLIPESAIERIEVLKDGASALYGSDALGGVINIVTKKGFTGNEITSKYTVPEKPGGGALDVSILSGSSNDRSDMLTVINYSRSEKIFGKDRDITKEGLSTIGSSAAYRDAGGTWHVDPSGTCPPDLVKPDPSGNGNRCFFRYNEIATTRPLINQVNLLTDYTYRLDSGKKFYNRNLVVFKDIEWNYAPTPAQFDTPAGTVTVPGARKVAYRFMEAGNRDNKDSERNYSTLLGLKGNVTDSWEWDLSAGYSRIHREDLGINGYIDGDVLNTLITNGTFDPFKPAGSRGDLSSALVQVFQQAESNLFTTDLVLTGEVGELSGGPVGAAVGLSAWNEQLDQKTDSKSASGVVLGSAGSNNTGGRDVTSAFGEFSLPFTSSLELSLAGRVDKYSDFGTSFNPKIGLKFNVDSSTLLRASLGTGFKAPTLSELFSASSEGYQTFIDRKACAANAAACQSSQYLVKSGGNRDLKEEKAFTGGVGLVYEPSTKFSLSVDGWYTKIKDVVGIDFEAMTEAELKGVDLASKGVTVTRDVNGSIDSVFAPNLNLQEEEISGIDLAADYELVNSLWGHRLNLQDDLSYLLFFNKEGFPGAGKRNVIGEWGFPGWRNSMTLGLKNNESSYNLTMRTIPGQNVIDREINEKIKMLNEFDLAASFKISKDSHLTAGVKNLLNSDQPADLNGGTGGAAEVNGDLYDINGRKFFVAFSQKY